MVSLASFRSPVRKKARKEMNSSVSSRSYRADDFDAQCVVAYEILQIVSCGCMDWCGSEKQKDNTLGDAYPWVDFWDIHSLEHLAWAIHNGVFMPGNKPALSGYYNYDRVLVGTLVT